MLRGEAEENNWCKNQQVAEDYKFYTIKYFIINTFTGI